MLLISRSKICHPDGDIKWQSSFSDKSKQRIMGVVFQDKRDHQFATPVFSEKITEIWACDKLD